ncbi:MAG: MFS transporter, partial [Candidatus Dormibacteraeota bacterium]|nr:MFS transporter [Candidatus Dormibacteraeota bacterium]
PLARAWLLVPAALAAFVVVGYPDGALGVAWPSIRAGFNLPLAALGIPLAAISVGFLASAAASGPLARRLGTSRMLLTATAGAGCALLLVAVSPVFAVLVAAQVLLGLSVGVLDAGLNAYFALRQSARQMNLLHSAYGAGTFLGPLVVTGSLLTLGSWRPAYLVAVLLEAAVWLAIWAGREDWLDAPTAAPRPRAALTAAARSRRLVLAAAIGTFFVYTGLEVSAGQWAYSFLSEARHLPPSVAGPLVSGYWGALTAGRLLAAGLGDRLRPTRLLEASLGLSLVGAALFWWSPRVWLGVAGLGLLGLGLAAIYPTLMTLTPARIGAAGTNNAVGFQAAGAGIGAALLPAAVGLVLQQRGLLALGPLLVALVLVMIAINWAASRPAVTAA